MRRFCLIAFLLITGLVHAQDFSKKVAETAMKIWPDSFAVKPGNPAKWSYDQGVILKGIEGIWLSTGDAKWFRYIQKQMDYFIQDDGTIKGYRPDEYNIDHINNGKLALLLYRVTGKEKYKKAADLLREQLRTHPRTSEGGFWHKKIYPNQMWLDGLYMGAPFYAEYAKVFGEDTAFNDVARQFILMERHARDPKTGLLYHGWDESRQQQWANKKTGLSPNVWGRALGWYGSAMVDALDHFPANHPGRDSIIAILNRFASAITKVQDKKSGLWYDVVNHPDKEKNYFEASASAMLVYTLAKGIRKGYLPEKYIKNARQGYDAILECFVKEDGDQTNFHGTVSVSGLGGKPYRDGSFEYYMSEPVVINDPKGVGAFINAAVEMGLTPNLAKGFGKKLLLDNYFNNETKTGANGRTISYHYTLDDKSNSGYSFFGFIFNKFGISTTELKQAPTSQNLKDANVYLIVDPDIPAENKNPNYIQQSHIDAIYDWVKKGGVLILLANDSNNVEFKNFNKLAGRFGITFNENLRNAVINNKFEQGTIKVPGDHPIFKTANSLYIKELSTINVSAPAKSIFDHNGEVIMAISKVGKGTVFALGDPWVYNEYVDGRKLPAEIENYKAAEDLVRWIIDQMPGK